MLKAFVKIAVAIWLTVNFSSCNTQTNMQHPYTNDLIHESSPYLLQHAHNPVNWKAWHEAVWQQAKKEDKLVIISIGYSACHWCHVMEHESFEDTAVANLMNAHFICIKVDREERPDVDQIYMDAVQLISGRGGWPLNAIALPDGRPIYAGTYFPKENWKQLLNYFVDYWKNNKDEALKHAEDITHGIKTMDVFSEKSDAVFSATDRNSIFARFDSITDYEKGGRKGAPKFPMPVNYQYLLNNYCYTNNAKSLNAVTATLNGMMDGGIYDHVGGGFARYSVDGDWDIPHFEKMLYDNAQLVSLYCNAYRVTKNEQYKEVVDETLVFIEREMSDPSGGFYSALDADSEGEEGKFYVWTYDELKTLLGADFDLFSKVYLVSPHGNFEGANHLRKNPGRGKVQVPSAKIKEWKSKLLAARNKRTRPLLDDKMLLSWNALMLQGFVDAYSTFGRQEYLERALNCAHFIQKNMLQKDYALYRNYKNGKSSISGFLDDYAFTCQAFIALYQATFDEQWLTLSNNIAAYTVQHFYNVNSGLFFYTSINDAPLIARKTESSDNVIPASNSAMAKVLFALGTIYDKPDYISMSKRALMNMHENVFQHPSYYANWAMLEDWFIDEPYEVAIVGPDAVSLQRQMNHYLLPNVITIGTATASQLPLLSDKFKPGETLIYVCRNKTCLLPVKTVAEALEQIKAGK
jgi:uncharacterized protein YyaL (SSP411 family)